MASETTKELGAMVTGTRAMAQLFNSKDMARLTNKSGGSVQTGDVLVQDTSTDESFTTTTTEGDLRPVYVVPALLGEYNSGTGDNDTNTLTIAADEAWSVYKPGAYVPAAQVDGAVSIGEYLKTSSTAKKLTGTGVQMGSGQPIPLGACAYALEAAAGAGTIAVLLLGETFSGAPVKGTPADGDGLLYSSADDAFVPGSVSMGYVLLTEEQAQNTAAGAFSSGSWVKRTPNQEKVDTDSICSLSSGQITLPAGTYRCRISCPAIMVDSHQARLYDTTGAATLVWGSSQRTLSTAQVQNRSEIVGRFTLSVQSVLEIQHRCQTTRAGDGLGFPANFGTEVYTIAEFWKE